MTNLALVNLDDLKILIAENEFKNEIWDSKQAADYLKVSLPTLHKNAAAGKIPHVRIGTEWKFSSIALYELVSKGGLEKTGSDGS